MSMFLHGLSQDDILALVQDLQRKFMDKERELNEQLQYVAELEEGVRTLAEKVESQSQTIASQSEELHRLQTESSRIESTWKSKLSTMELSYSQKLKTLTDQITHLQEENDSCNQLLNEMEEVLNAQQSKILDLQANSDFQGIRIENNLEEKAVEEEEETDAVNISLLSKDTEDEEDEEEDISPVDLKINRNLSGRMGQLRRGHSQQENSPVDENLLVGFRPVKTVENTEPASLFGKKTPPSKERETYPVPPMPPPSPLSKFDRSSLRNRESPSADIPKPPQPSTTKSWKDAKKHESLFQPAIAYHDDSVGDTDSKGQDSTQRIQYFRWAVDEDEK